MTGPAPQRETPPRKTGCRRRLLIALLAAGIAVGALGAWLFRPARVPRGSLLAFMPADMAVGVELRSVDRMRRRAAREALLRRLARLPVTTTAEAMRGKAPGTAEETARALFSRAERILDAPWGLGLIGRSLNGSVAIASTDTRFRDAVVLCTLDNAGWTAMRLALLARGVESEGLPAHLVLPRAGERDQRGPAALFATLEGDCLVAATTRERLADVLASLRRDKHPRPLAGRKRLPQACTVLHLRPNGEIREATARRLGSGLWPLREAAALLTVEGDRVRVEAWGTLTESILRDLPTKTPGASTGSTGPGRRAFLARQTPELFQAAGYLHPECAWTGLCRKLWGGRARPLRGVSQPVTIFAWEWLDRGVIRHADGRFLLRLEPPPDLKEDHGVPPAPGFAALWGVDNATACRADFETGLRRWVAYYAAPGGSELYEQVRKTTRVVSDEHGGRVVLHPLFFNHMKPAWSMEEHRARFHSQSGALNPPDETATFAPGALADVAFVWRADGRDLEKIRAYLEDKIVAHGFAKETARPRVMRAVDFILALARSLPEGEGVLQVREKEENDGAAFPFRFEIGLRLHSD